MQRFITTYFKSYVFAARHRKSKYAALGLTLSEIARLYRHTHLSRCKKTLHTKLYGAPIVAFNDHFWFLHSVDEVFVDDIYNCSLEGEHPVILDCGANIGLSVIYFKRLFPGAAITAFEPDKSLSAHIQSNLKAQGFTDVTVINKAVWKATTTLSFHADGNLGGAIAAADTGEIPNLHQVEAIRLRDFLATKVDFLKIDIEGAEYDVLKDCKDLLGNVANMFLEYHGNGDEPQKLHEMLEWVQEAGFRYHIKQAWENQTQPFLQKLSKGRDQQLNIFCYRT